MLSKNCHQASDGLNETWILSKRNDQTKENRFANELDKNRAIRYRTIRTGSQQLNADLPQSKSKITLMRLI